MTTASPPPSTTHGTALGTAHGTAHGNGIHELNARGRIKRPRTIHGSEANTSRVGRLLAPSPLPLEKIRRILRTKRMRSIAVAPLAAESGISRPMLSMILGDQALPGLDTLCLLLAWDEQFDEPVWEYMIERGRALRAANLAKMASDSSATDSSDTTASVKSTA